jgi:hypothetical protein
MKIEWEAVAQHRENPICQPPGLKKALQMDLRCGGNAPEHHNSQSSAEISRGARVQAP